MMRHRPPGATLCAIALLLPACGSSSGGSLFQLDDPGPTGGTAGIGLGSGASPATGGNGGSFTASGGMPASGGTSSSGGGSGLDASADSGGLTGSGGTTELDGSVAACDYSGTWGTYIRVPVSWPDAPFVLIGGTGTLQQWNLTEQEQQGIDVHARTVPCMIFLPDLQSSLFGGFYKYGIRFPLELFDNGGIPPADFVLSASLASTGILVQSDPFAILVGLSMTNPTTTTWPGTHYLSLEDHDSDGSPGVTVIPAIDQGYSRPPADLAGNYADRVYIAERTVSRLSGTLTSCDEVALNVEILSVGGQTGIQSSVVGCHLENGSECTQEQADFIDGIRPQYTPTGLGTSTSVRMPPGSTCADVRAKFPVQ